VALISIEVSMVAWFAPTVVTVSIISII
jgi:hypothetical protein